LITGAWKAPSSKNGVSVSSTAADAVASRFSRVHPERPAFIVIKVEKIEADAAIDRRRDLELPAAMGEGPQCQLEERPPTASKTTCAP